MKKFLIGAAIGGVVSYWAHRKGMQMLEAIAKSDLSAPKAEPAPRPTALHAVK